MPPGVGVQAALGDAEVQDITVPKALILQELTDAGPFDPGIQPFLDQVSDSQAVERDLPSVLDDLPDGIGATQAALANGDQIIVLGMSADGLNRLIARAQSARNARASYAPGNVAVTSTVSTSGSPPSATPGSLRLPASYRVSGTRTVRGRDNRVCGDALPPHRQLN